MSSEKLPISFQLGRIAGDMVTIEKHLQNKTDVQR